MVDSLPDQYRFLQVIGSGVFGTVILAEQSKNKSCVAIKKISGSFSDIIDAQRVYREISYLKLFKTHPNVITLLDVDYTPKGNNVFLVFELMSSDLQKLIDKKCLKDDQKRYIMYQLFRALKYIHSINVAHRDLKPSNLLLNKNCDLKMADFGLAKVTSILKIPNGIPVANATDDLIPLTEYIATRWYRAPELLVCANTFTTAIDVWSAGCIMGEMLLNRPLFPGANTPNQIECVMSALPIPTLKEIEEMCSGFFLSTLQRACNKPKRMLRQILGSLSEDSLSLMETIIVFNVDKRWKAEDCMKHSYFESFFNVEHLSEKPPFPSINEDNCSTIADLKQNILKEVRNIDSFISTISKEIIPTVSDMKISETKDHKLTDLSSTGLWW